jgi:hypothetical protein
MDQGTLATVGVIVFLLLGFLLNYLVKDDIM